MKRAANQPAAKPLSMAAKPSNSRLGSEASGFDSPDTPGSRVSDTAAAATMIPAMVRYTLGQLCHWSAQIKAIPPDSIIARR